MSQEMQQYDEVGLSSLAGSVQITLPNLLYQQFQPIQYNQKAALGLGITQMTLGILCIISNILMISVISKENLSKILFYGIWGGILIIVAGILEELSSRKTPNVCLIISSMVMSALAACVGAIVLSLGILDSYIQGNPIGYHDVTRDSRIPISFHVTGNQLVMGYHLTNSDYQALARPPSQGFIPNQPSFPESRCDPTFGTENNLPCDQNGLYDDAS